MAETKLCVCEVGVKKVGIAQGTSVKPSFTKLGLVKIHSIQVRPMEYDIVEVVPVERNASVNVEFSRIFERLKDLLTNEKRGSKSQEARMLFQAVLPSSSVSRFPLFSMV